MSVHNLAELIRLAAANPGSRVLNACDPDVPTVAEIGAEIDALMGVDTPKTTLLDGPAPSLSVGKSPWMVDHPVVCDMTAAERELGYQPIAAHPQSLTETVEWLAGQLAGRDWKEVFPLLAYAQPHLFDYEAEDAWFTEVQR
ncbi:hypothetical protein D3C78_1044490 [compost metagenome]